MALIWIIGWYAWDIPDVDTLNTAPRRPSVTVIATDGSHIGSRGDLHAAPVEISELPPFMVQAVIATEDRRFFSHVGFDPIGLVRAVYVNVTQKGVRQGGSTLTQQLAKNLFFTPERTIRRKVQELLAALWLEAKFSKQQILKIYLNRVYFGDGTYGVGAASRHYFGRPPRHLTLREAAALIGMLKAPSYYSPIANPEGSRRRAAIVLRNMVVAGYISLEDAQYALRQPMRVHRPPSGTSASYFTDWVMNRVAGYVDPARRGDLIVHTTLDPRLQQDAAAAVDTALSRDGKRHDVDQGAMVVLAPDGAVRAMVGGRSYRKSQFNRATQALRQPGSAFKLFVYLAGLEAGLRPDDLMTDRPLRVQGWTPKNYSRRYRGEITLETAFAKSVNTVAVQVSEKVGRRRVTEMARRLGITSNLTSHPSLALGASEASLLELTSAYAVLANSGRAAWPFAIREIRDTAGNTLYRRRGASGGRIIASRHVENMERMLVATIDSGTGRSARIGRTAAGKTGTSQDFRDAWFVGYSGGLVAGVWVGNDDNRPMRKVTGGGIPARVWADFMRRSGVAADDLPWRRNR